MRIDRLLILAGLAVGALELMTLVLDRRHLAFVTGVVLAAIVLGCAAALTAADYSKPAPSVEDRQWEETFARWQARTSTLLMYADGSRADWDRHIRPMLAREFQLYLGYNAESRVALGDSGQMYLGPQLWQWVDPAATQVLARDEPGPGRATLSAIVERMSQL